MPPSTTKPTIVLIPGSFCPSALLWDAVTTQLNHSGYDTLALELPTVNAPSTAPPKTMADDAAHIHGVIDALINHDGKDVLVAMHSYGGIPGTQAVRGLTRKEREKQQQQGRTLREGGVVGLVYVSSLLVNEGESSEDSFAGVGGEPPDIFGVSGEYLYPDPVKAAPVILSDLPQEVGEAWARKMPGHAMGSFREKMTSTSHYDVPVTYVKCTEDRVVVPAHQQKMIDDFREVSKSEVHVVEVRSGHCPMVSYVNRTAEVIMEAARRA